MVTRPKVPKQPPGPLTFQPGDKVSWTGPLWRVHKTDTPHPLGWKELRMYGPLADMRWDPMPDPLGVHPNHAVTYAAADLMTALAEVGQARRTIDRASGAPYAVQWEPTRPLQLLDLTRTWPIRNGASAALSTAGRPVCRAWARAICDQAPHLDGLQTTSTMTGQTAVTLFTPAKNSFPDAPLTSIALADPAMAGILAGISRQIGYKVIG